MFCSKCGSKLPDGARFCGHCGAPVKTVSAGENTQETAQQDFQQSDFQETAQQGYVREPDSRETSQQDYGYGQQSGGQGYEHSQQSGGQSYGYGYGGYAPPYTAQKSKTGKEKLETIGMTVSGLVVVLLLFLPWISIPFGTFFVQGVISFSLFEIGDASQALSQLGLLGSGSLSVLFVCVLVGMILAVVLITAAWIGAWKKNTVFAALGIAGSALGMVLTLALQIYAIVLASNLNLMQDNISLTAVPGLTLAVFAVNLIFTVLFLKNEDMLRRRLPVILIGALGAAGIMVAVTLLVLLFRFASGYMHTPRNQEQLPGIFDEWTEMPDSSAPMQYR